MAINFIKKEDLSHITRTTRQWETTIDRYEIIPKGVLCIELCNDKLTKIKIGNGHLIYEQLPYVSDVNLSDYYTKEETNNLIKDLKAIKIKGEASSLSDLPLHGNEEGDLWFVKKQDPDTHNRYDEYIWYKNKWESFGSSDIDLSEYAKKSYVDTHIQEVQNEITEIIESGYLHKHDNKNILDHTSAVYNVEKDNKLRDLHNYDDTELREKAHTHLNKNILDQTDAVYNRDKDDKLSSLHNYDDTDVKDRISTLESVAHSHDNQDILNRTTAAFTKEQVLQLLDCKDFEGTDGVHDGYHGFVPAPTKDDIGKVLGANGQWVEGGGGGGGDVVAQGGGIEITTDPQTGVKTVSVNAGTGLDIDQQTGELYVTSTGGDTIAEGSGIDITTDSQTGVKTISVDTGDGLTVNQDNELEVSLGNGLQFDANDAIEVNTGDGLSINQDNELEVSTGRALSINNNNEIDVDIATRNSLGAIKVGSGLNIDEFGNLSTQAAPFRIGRALSLDDESVRLPSAYYKAKYVQTDGQARCYTGFYPSNYPNAKYVGTASVIGDTNGYKYIFGTEGDNYNSTWSMILSTSSDNQSIITGLTYNNNNDKVNNPIVTAFAKGDMINFEASITAGLKINNELVQSLSTTFTKPTNEMFIFGERAGYNTNARLYSFKIYNSDDTLLANFVPAVRKSDNEVGFYETVSNQFINSNYYGPPFTTDMDDLDVDDPDWVLNADIATASSLGVIKPSDGLSIDNNGVLSVNVGDGLFIDSTNNDVNVKIGQALSINVDNEIDVDIATATSLGVVKAGSGLNIDEFGNLSTQAAPFRIGRALSLDDESVRLPSGYAKAKYVANPSSAAVRINFRPSDYPNAKYTTSVSLDSCGSSSSYPTRYLCGASGWTGSLKIPLDGISGGLPIKTFFYIGNGNNPEYTSTAFQFGDRFDIEASVAGGYKINNEVVQASATPPSNFGTYYLAIFGSGASNGPGEPGFIGKMYYFRIYNSDDTLLCNLVPAVRRADDVVGFYDMVGNQFYPSETSTAFTTDMDDLDVDDPDWVLNASIATSNSLGVVKPSTGLTVNEHGALTLDKASASTIGGVRVGNNLSIDSNGVLSANIIKYSGGHAIEIVGDLSIDKFRWEITKNAGGSMVAFRYFEYSDSTHTAFTVQSGTIAWSDGSTVSYPDGFDETFAGMMEDRTKCTVIDWTGDKTLIMTFTLSQSIMLSDIAYFRWKTDDYMSGRQPQEFNIYAHDSINDEWILLKEVTDHALVPSSGNAWSDYIDIEPEIEPRSINVKYGNGLTVNQNNELEVVGGGGGTEYRPGKAIEFEHISSHLILTDFSNTDFIASITSANAGSFVKAADNSTITLTATGTDCYTKGIGGDGSASGSYAYNVKAETQYRLMWDSSDTTVPGRIMAFENAEYTNVYVEDQSVASFIDFTTSSTCTFITTRLGITNTGDSVTFSNVRLYEYVEDTLEYDEISVKYDNGLTVNSNNELEVVLSNGLEFDPNATETMVADEMYLFASNVSCQVHTDNPSYSIPTDRTYQKTTTEPALCCLWEVGDSGSLWTGPLIVGLTQTSVQYTAQDTQQTVNYQNTFTYLDKTWYTSGYPDFLNNADHEDKLGNLQYLGSYAAVTDQIQAAKDLIDLANVQFVSNAGIQVKLGNGLQFDGNNAIEVTGGGSSYTAGEGIQINPPTTQGDPDVISTKIGHGIEYDDNDALSYDYDSYVAGRAISITPNIETIDAWKSGEGVGNFAYTSATSNQTASWSKCVHTPVSSVSDLFELKSTKFRVIVRDINDNHLSVRLDLHRDVFGVHYNNYEYIQTDDIFDIADWCETNDVELPKYISFGIATLLNPNQDDISKSTVKSIDIVWVYDEDYPDSYTINTDLATQSSAGVVKPGIGTRITENGEICTDIMYPGDGISFTPVYNEFVIDAWNSGTGWTNSSYESSTSTGYVSWNRSVHSNPSLATLFEVKQPKLRIFVRDTDYLPLNYLIDFHDENGTHYGSTSFILSDDVYDLKTFVDDNYSGRMPSYISIGLYTRISPNSQNISPSQVYQVDLIWVDEDHNQGNIINVSVSDGLTFTQNNELKLSTATTSSIGGIKVGDNLTISDDGTLSARGKEIVAGEGIDISPISSTELIVDNQEYYFDSQVICEIHGDFNRTFQKTTAVPALGVIWKCYDSGNLWGGPLFVGLTADAVKYTTEGTTYNAQGTFSYLDRTWYYSDTSYFVRNPQDQDFANHLQVFTEAYPTVADIVQAAKDLIDVASVVLNIDRISVKCGDGLTIVNDEICTIPYVAGEGISIGVEDNTLPEGYTRIRALSSTVNGNQYINTGYKMNPNTVLDIKCTLHKRNSSVWAIPLGARSSNNTADTGMLFITTYHNEMVPSTGNDTPSLWIGNYTTNVPAADIESFYNDIVDLHFDSNSLTCYNERTHHSTTLLSSGSIPQTVYDLYVFATNNHGSAEYFGQLDLYEMTISENDTIIHKYIPCKQDSDDKYGLYDLIDNGFKLSPNNNAFSFVSGTPIDNTDEIISIKPATDSTLGGIKVGTGLSMDTDGYLSTGTYTPGLGVFFLNGDTDDTFIVRHKEYYFDDIVSCQISGNYGPRTFTRLSDEPCLMALMKYNTTWCMPIIVGLTAESVDLSQDFDSTILHSKGTVDYKGYTWYVNADYGLTNGSMVDLMGNLQTLPDMYTYDSTSYDAFVATLMDVARDLINAAAVVESIKSEDVWNSGTGWLNGSYWNSTSDQFASDWYYTYHSSASEYYELPEAIEKMRMIAISVNDTRFQGGSVDCFDSSHHHFASIGCITDEWFDIPEGTVYVQFAVKWNELDDTYIYASDIKSVTFQMKLPIATDNSINVGIGDGLTYDGNNQIAVNTGDGITVDTNNKLTLDTSIQLIIHCVPDPES